MGLPRSMYHSVTMHVQVPVQEIDDFPQRIAQLRYSLLFEMGLQYPVMLMQTPIMQKIKQRIKRLNVLFTQGERFAQIVRSIFHNGGEQFSGLGRVEAIIFTN